MKILLPASLAPSREDALRLAIGIAADGGAEVRVLFVVDRDGIRRREAGAPPGAIHIARKAEEEIAERLTSEGGKVVDLLCRDFRAAGVRASGDVRAGSPRDEIEAAASECDLLVAGAGSRYAFDLGDEPGKLILSLMNDKILPVLLAAPFRGKVGTVVVGCGGGSRSARAVGAMARLGLWKAGPRIVLLAVADARGKGEESLADPRRILADAGYARWEEKVIPGPKVEAFLAFCEREGADAAVLGGWGQHRWNEYLGMSITGRLLDEGRRHLFLYM